ncbi:2-keto-4-pentenoate hydratase/2-oxohepta-3-ene-1,7-dioic acid hydratase [Aciduliprofundum sp. MAR08-339]|uniref:fumarylacetoacetate hydrolase family protein n=1 Tax=Aciduliprofundum sp. (strain MAR08-339) TaxID=673860 RepID=UPI0002A48E8C|nr:2-keto-4-pentenoate hydratase/2-oxohepta-3-ene-1,7-dioic acid hydratase [Aciduliprofundum sp. MAR08-339]
MLKLPFMDGEYRVKPSKILCLGRNYVKHAREMKSEVPKEPVIFLKPPSSLVGPDSIILLPPPSKTVHHEVELAVVIGKGGKNIGVKDATSHVLGYTILLDITARDLQAEAKKKGLPWSVAKGFDTFAPIGPRIVPAESIDPHHLEIGLKVNGEIRQKGSTEDMIFKVPEVISYISKIMTLEPGDIIATGTPEGVGEIKDGDVIEAWIEGIGVLRERVRRDTR